MLHGNWLPVPTTRRSPDRITVDNQVKREIFRLFRNLVKRFVEFSDILELPSTNSFAILLSLSSPTDYQKILVQFFGYLFINLEIKYRLPIRLELILVGSWIKSQRLGKLKTAKDDPSDLFIIVYCPVSLGCY